MEEQSQTWQNWLASRVSDAFVVGLGWEDKDAIRLRYILWKETLQRHLATLVTFPRHKMSISKCMLMHSTPKWNMPSGDACIFCPAASTSSLPQLTARLTLSRQEGRKERKKIWRNLAWQMQRIGYGAMDVRGPNPVCHVKPEPVSALTLESLSRPYTYVEDLYNFRCFTHVTDKSRTSGQWIAKCDIKWEPKSISIPKPERYQCQCQVLEGSVTIRSCLPHTMDNWNKKQRVCACGYPVPFTKSNLCTRARSCMYKHQSNKTTSRTPLAQTTLTVTYFNSHKTRFQQPFWDINTVCVLPERTSPN